jgi:hypothetical protein
MTAKNDVTGDLLKSKPTTKQYEDNYDKIFSNDRVARITITTNPPVESACRTEEHVRHGFNRDASHSLGRYVCDCEVTVDWDEKRIDIIGQNGNEGDHY